jgi:hypothetical protein
MQIFCLETPCKYFILFIYLFKENREKFQTQNLLQLLSMTNLSSSAGYAVPECFNLHSASEDLLLHQRVLLSESEEYSQMLKYKGWAG